MGVQFIIPPVAEWVAHFTNQQMFIVDCFSPAQFHLGGCRHFKTSIWDYYRLCFGKSAIRWQATLPVLLLESIHLVRDGCVSVIDGQPSPISNSSASPSAHPIDHSWRVDELFLYTLCLIELIDVQAFHLSGLNISSDRFFLSKSLISHLVCVCRVERFYLIRPCRNIFFESSGFVSLSLQFGILICVLCEPKGCVCFKLYNLSTQRLQHPFFFLSICVERSFCIGRCIYIFFHAWQLSIFGGRGY